MLFDNGDYGFIALEKMPAGPYREVCLPFAGVDWARTADYSSIAHNHCGAVCVTNLALYFAAADESCRSLKRDGSRDETFRAVHRIIGNGPVVTIAGGAKKYFSACGHRLRHGSIRSFAAFRQAIRNGRPCAVLLMRHPADWHWVLAVGWRQYASGEVYIRIADGWHAQANYFYTRRTGAVGVAAAQYWIQQRI